jgi:hypothetical protein
MQSKNPCTFLLKAWMMYRLIFAIAEFFYTAIPLVDASG